MILDSTLKIEAVLAGAITTSQPEVHVEYVDWNSQSELTRPAEFRVALNSSTDVTILAAPAQRSIREVLRITIYNKDTVSVTCTVKTDDGTTEYILVKQSIPTLQSLCWEKGVGWYGMIIPETTTGQIIFPATQNPSGDANTLDDYEEGTWTPALTFATPGDVAVAYTTQVGGYTKIGNMVTASFNIVTSSFTHTTASGNATITGLPFTSNSTSGRLYRGPLDFQGITKLTYTNFVTALANSATSFVLVGGGTGVGRSLVTAADMPTGGSVILTGSLTYHT